ncbi:MAG: DegT/DnrJ/EryC1/StrS family aminotransferase [Alphaproteobacteria bacterium]
MTKDAFLPFSKPCLTEETINDVVDSLRSGWLTTGPKVKKFEALLQDYLSCPNICVLSSGTAGLHLALLHLNLQPGDEVITTSFTFIATLNTIVLAGGTPVLVDVERNTYNMDVSQIEAAITPRTKAIMPVHFAGAPVDLDPLYELAKKYGLRVVEDAAHAIGTQYKGQRIGSFGDTQVFSFHPNKNITTGEGGCVSSQDKDLIKHINVLKFHGIDRESWNRFSKEGSQLYDVIAPGFKYNMMDLQAALGVHQLPLLDDFTDRRTRLVEKYREALEGWEEFILPEAPTYDHRHAWDLFAPTLNAEKTNISRNELIDKLKEENIGAGLHWQAPHLFSFYKKTFGFKEGDFPHAEYIADHVLSLPLFPQMTDDEHTRVIKALKKIFKKD